MPTPYKKNVWILPRWLQAKRNHDNSRTRAAHTMVGHTSVCAIAVDNDRPIYQIACVSTDRHSSWVSMRFRRLAWAFCVLVFMGALSPVRADSLIAVQTDVVLVAGQILNGEQPSDSDAPPSHITAQCMCGIGVLSDVAEPMTFFRIAYLLFDISETSLLRLNLPDPLFKPPRA